MASQTFPASLIKKLMQQLGEGGGVGAVE